MNFCVRFYAFIIQSHDMVVNVDFNPELISAISLTFFYSSNMSFLASYLIKVVYLKL